MNPVDGAPELGGAPAAFSGSRLSWRDLPRHVRELIAEHAGAQVVAEVVATSGFSPGFAGVLELADGHQVFVKAVSPAQNPHSPVLARQEIRAARAIPASVPAPRLLWSDDDGDWVLMGFEAVAGRSPELPWRPRDLDRVLAGLAELARATPVPGHELPTMTDSVAENLTGWQSFAALSSRERSTIAERAGGLGEWASSRLDALVAWEQAAPAASAGESLVHGDLRADNVMIDGEHLWFVDWPHACVGAPWLDLALMAPSVAMQGGGAAHEVFAKSTLANSVGRDELRAVVTAVTGFFTWGSLQPDPPGLPNLRAFQRAQAYTAIAWLQQLAD